MLILKHARGAVLLSLVCLGGTAAAQGTPDPNQQPTSDMNDPNQPAPTTTETTETTETDTTVVTPPPPAPVVVNNEPTYVAPTTTEPVYEEEESMLEQYGIAVALGGGVEGFTDDTARTLTNDGGGWNLRVAAGTRSPIGFEAAYIGSAQSIDALGLDSDAILVGNGLEGKVRVNFLDATVQPFAFGGIGWRHYSLTSEDFNTSAVADSDDVFEIPVGAGIATKWQGFMFDARAEYRYTMQEDLMPSLNDIGDDASLHRWGVNANIGLTF